MASKYASANGRWSQITWLDGPAGDPTTAPADGDTVYLNGKTVTLDVNTGAASINGTGVLATLAPTASLSTDPVKELIAQDLLGVLTAINTGNGYSYSLDAHRRSNDPHTHADGLAVLHAADDEELSEDQEFTGLRTYQRHYLVELHVTEDATGAVALDRKLDRRVADVEKAIMADPYRGGYARNTKIFPAVHLLDPSGELLGAVVIARVQYRTNESDPYSLN